MTVSTLAFMGMSFMKPRTHRLFHYITAAITLVAAISYFSMGSGLGQTPIAVEFVRDSVGGAAGYTRQIYYVRYIDWYVTTLYPPPVTQEKLTGLGSSPRRCFFSTCS